MWWEKLSLSQSAFKDALQVAQTWKASLVL